MEILSNYYITGGAGCILLLLVILILLIRRYKKRKNRPIKLPPKPSTDELRLKLAVDVDSSVLTNPQDKAQGNAHYLVFDTETFDAISFHDESKQTYKISRPVALSWMILDACGLPLHEESHILKVSEQGDMHPDAIAIHGISNEMIQAGEEPEAVYQAFQAALSQCKAIVAHNLQFHKTVLVSDLERLGLSALATQLAHYPNVICTMEWGRQLGFKHMKDTVLYPSLDELFGYLFFKRMHLPLSYRSKTVRDIKLVAACLRTYIGGTLQNGVIARH